MWKENNAVLSKTWQTKNFVEAVDFINRIKVLAENEQHHPDIHLTNYNQLRIELTTHDAGNKITEKDRKLAQLIDEELES